MKKILLALTVFGFIQYSADAKGKSKFDKNYRVCTVNSKYKVCGADAPLVTNTKAIQKNAPVVASLRRMDTYTHLGYGTNTGHSNKMNPRIRVSYDEPDDAYQGKESMINDGVQNNIHRNLRYLDNSIQLPPNDGGNSK